ncbi:unnamed protein product [Rhodiola kirilowii]
MGSGDAEENKAEDVLMDEEEVKEEAGEEKEEVKEEAGEASGKDRDSEMKDAEQDVEGEGKKKETEEVADDDEKDDDAEEEEEKEEDEDEKEPVTPTDRPTRKRKSVERYSEQSSVRSTTPKSVSIGKGNGEKLSDIPNVAYKLSKKKPDDNLQLLHSILFGKKAKVHMLKKNIGQFSGFVWLENEEKQKAKVKEKIDKCVKDKLIEFCYLLDIQIANKKTIKKEELSVKLVEFLQSPHATTDALLADTEQKNKKRKATPTKAGESSATPAKVCTTVSGKKFHQVNRYCTTVSGKR